MAEQSNQPTDQPQITDWLMIKEVSFNGVSVLVQIDRREEKISLVEWNPRTKQYEPKKWEFSGRTLGYAKSWLHIMNVMERATSYGIKELERIKDEKLVSTARVIAAVQDAKEKHQQ